MAVDVPDGPEALAGTAVRVRRGPRFGHRHQPVAVTSPPAGPGRTAAPRSATGAPPACADPRSACAPGRPWPPSARPVRPEPPAPALCCSRSGARPSSTDASSSSASARPPRRSRPAGREPTATGPGGPRSRGRWPEERPVQPAPEARRHRFGRGPDRPPGHQPVDRPTPSGTGSKGTFTHRLAMVDRAGGRSSATRMNTVDGGGSSTVFRSAGAARCRPDGHP